MSETETVRKTLDRIIDVDLPKAIESIMASTKLPTQRKTAFISQADTCLSQLRILRGALE